MASETDFPSRGKVISVTDESIVFTPSNTTYQIELQTPRGRYDGPVNELVDGIIRATARKMYTVPSGGGWLEPIFGTPRTVQGRVRHVDPRYLVLHCGAFFLVRVPESDSAIDLVNGPFRIGAMANATLHSGATFELIGAVVPA